MMIMCIMMMNTAKSCEKKKVLGGGHQFFLVRIPFRHLQTNPINQWPLIIEAGRLQVQQPKTRICKQLSLSAYKKTKKKKRERRGWCSAFFFVSVVVVVPVFHKVTIPAQQVVKVVGNQTSTGSHARALFSCRCSLCLCIFSLLVAKNIREFQKISSPIFSAAAALCV
ncbi:hypothetical protein GHT06_016240 [Daphnia sinensis]|uniref:Uncharacterized protein n=1 Tax=Daphnia sinensis TaxID=1820382 RepID=A0AAD5KNC5_9CRUS|nr:hypothetical protein GHT06_016240 [Daphnia sinensis]